MKVEIDVKNSAIIFVTGLIGFVLIYSMFSMNNFNRISREQQTSNIVEVIQKAAVQCYALEGEYPPNLEYLVKRYGVMIDEKNFIYHYDANAISNGMPDIVVLTID